MAVVFLILWSASGPIRLEPIQGRIFSNIGCWMPGMVSLGTGQPLFMGNQEEEFWLVDLETGDATPYRFANFRVSSVACRDDYLYVSGFRNETQVTQKVDRTGKILAERSGAFTVLRFLGEELVGTTYEGRGSPMVYVMDPNSLETRKSFFKTSEGVQENRTISTTVWLTRRNGVFFIMDGTLDRVYFGTADRLVWEGDRSNLVPNTYPFIELALPDYTQPRAFGPRQPMLREYILGIIDYYDWRFRLSYGLYFDEIADGFVFCYEVPDRINDIYIGNHLAIQFLNSAFKPVGPPLERFGQIVGVANNAVYVLYPDGPEPLPSESGALKEHYGFDRFETLESVRDLFLRYRELVDGLHHPSIEIIRPELLGGTP